MDGARSIIRRLLLAWVALCAPGLAQQSVPTAPVGGGPLFAAPPGGFAPPAQAPAVVSPTGDAACGPGCETFTPGSLAAPGAGPWETGPGHRPWLLRQLDLRHSSLHGRAMGPGGPLRGTSWLNRPYWLSLDTGALVMTDRPAPNVRTGNDIFGALGVGWDWDHYWGTQARVVWSTPELLNTTQTALPSDDNLFIADLSLLYYPWGDSRLRPYYRLGLGLTDLEYTNDLGRRTQANLFTIPIGVGLKYQFSRNFTWRLELADNIALGQNETSSLNNFTFTTGVEWRFGGRHAGTWGYKPRTGAW